MTDSQQLLDTIRSLSEGDEIRVEFGAKHANNKEREFYVTNVSRGPHPLVDLDAMFETERVTTLALEHDENYTDGTPYNIRWLSNRVHDGNNVYDVETL